MAKSWQTNNISQKLYPTDFIPWFHKSAVTTQVAVAFIVQITEDNIRELASMCILSYGRCKDMEDLNYDAIPYLAVANSGDITIGYLKDYLVIYPESGDVKFLTGREYHDTFDNADSVWSKSDWNIGENTMDPTSSTSYLDILSQNGENRVMALKIYLDLCIAVIQRNYMFHELKAKEMFDND